MVPHSVRIRPAKTRRLLLLRYFATSGLTAENFPNELGTHRLELYLNRCRCSWNWELQGRTTSAGGRKPLVGISSFVLFPPFQNYRTLHDLPIHIYDGYGPCEESQPCFRNTEQIWNIMRSAEISAVWISFPSTANRGYFWWEILGRLKIVREWLWDRMHSPESSKTQPLFEDSDPLHGLRTTNTQVRASKFSGSEANEGGKNVKNHKLRLIFHVLTGRAFA